MWIDAPPSGSAGCKVRPCSLGGRPKKPWPRANSQILTKINKMAKIRIRKIVVERLPQSVTMNGGGNQLCVLGGWPRVARGRYWETLGRVARVGHQAAQTMQNRVFGVVYLWGGALLPLSPLLGQFFDRSLY